MKRSLEVGGESKAGRLSSADDRPHADAEAQEKAAVPRRMGEGTPAAPCRER